MKISHLNVHSYLAKHEYIITDQAMARANDICFSGTLLQPQQQLENTFLPIKEECTIFRFDRTQTRSGDLAEGGMMIVCPSLQPIRVNIERPTQLEVVSIIAHAIHSDCRMCLVTVYRRPQQELAVFLSLLGNYLANLPQMVPTIIVGDFNEDLLSRLTSSRILKLMSSRGFSQLVQVPTTDSGSLLDHIYYNGITEDAVVDVIDTIRTMMPHICPSHILLYR